MTAAHFLIHFLGPLTVATKPNSIDHTRVFTYGEELLFTEQVRIANTDRNGDCPLLDYLDDVEAQVARFGRQMVARGPWDRGSRLEPGSPAFVEAREAARQAAHKIENEADKMEALAQVTRDFGPAQTSRTTAVYR